MKKSLFLGPEKIEDRFSVVVWCHLSFCFGCDLFIVPELWNYSFCYFDKSFFCVAKDTNPLFGPLASLPPLDYEPLWAESWVPLRFQLIFFLSLLYLVWLFCWTLFVFGLWIWLDAVGLDCVFMPFLELGLSFVIFFKDFEFFIFSIWFWK